MNASAVTLVVDPAASTASYHAHEQLVGRTLPSEAVGTTAGVSGSLAFAADGTIVADQSKISVDLSKLQSDESRRDNFIKGNTLQTSRYPMATFVPTAVQGLPSPLPTSGQVTFQLLGDLTVHGVTKPVIHDAQVVTRLMLPMGLSYDHRVIDGGGAARFMVDLVKGFETFHEEHLKL